MERCAEHLTRSQFTHRLSLPPFFFNPTISFLVLPHALPKLTLGRYNCKAGGYTITFGLRSRRGRRPEVSVRNSNVVTLIERNVRMNMYDERTTTEPRVGVV